MKNGTRMAELVEIVRAMGGRSPSQSAAYMRLTYKNGGHSNQHGSAVMDRCIRAGLLVRDERQLGERGNPVKVAG